MEHNNILQQILIYFAKYPDYDGVLRNFKNSNGSEGYQSFKSKILKINNKSLIPGIKDYVFGANDKAVLTKLQNLRDVYLFVDYGAISSAISSLCVKEDNMDVAITIAKPSVGNAMDGIEELIELDRMLDIIRTIQRDLREDKNDPFVKMLNYNFDIVPFNSDKLYNSYGWTLIFKIRGVNFL